jgi:hypothetical protein
MQRVLKEVLGIVLRNNWTKGTLLSAHSRRYQALGNRCSPPCFRLSDPAPLEGQLLLFPNQRGCQNTRISKTVEKQLPNDDAPYKRLREIEMSLRRVGWDLLPHVNSGGG